MLSLLVFLSAPLYADSVAYTFQSSPGLLGDFPDQRVQVSDSANSSTILSVALDPVGSGLVQPIGELLAFPGPLVPQNAIVHAAQLSVGSFSRDIVLPTQVFAGGATSQTTGLKCGTVGADCQPPTIQAFVSEFVVPRFGPFPCCGDSVTLSPGGEYDLLQLFGPSVFSHGAFDLGVSAEWKNHISIIDPGYNATRGFEYDALNPETLDLSLHIAYSIPEPASLLLLGFGSLILSGALRRSIRA